MSDFGVPKTVVNGRVVRVYSGDSYNDVTIRIPHSETRDIIDVRLVECRAIVGFEGKIRESIEYKINEAVRRVAELPDRTSPDDWPEAMLITGNELRNVLQTFVLVGAFSALVRGE